MNSMPTNLAGREYVGNMRVDLAACGPQAINDRTARPRRSDVVVRRILIAQQHGPADDRLDVEKEIRIDPLTDRNRAIPHLAIMVRWRSRSRGGDEVRPGRHRTLP